MVSYLTDHPIETSALLASVIRPSDGASVVFEGVVRNHHDGRAVESIDYEAYRPMAEKEFERILRTLQEEFATTSIAFRHRLGRLVVGETSIVIVATAPHREEAFAACRSAIDRIKQSVPIWKRERGPFGEEWVGWQK